MSQTKIPVTVTPELKLRVEALVQAVQNEILPNTRFAVTSSGICCLAIEEMLARFERRPRDLVMRLGFALSSGA